MEHEKEYEIVQHTLMKYLEILMVEMTSRNPHGHSDLEIGLILRGDLELNLDQEHIRLKENDIYVINRYQVHSFAGRGRDSLILAFQINSEFYRNLTPKQNRYQFQSVIRTGSAVHERLRAGLTECAQSYYRQIPFFEMKCAALLFDTLYQLAGLSGSRIISDKEYDTNRSSTLRLNRVLEYITQHEQEQISLSELAGSEHITPDHLSHFIKKALGMSFQEYVSNLRFEQAYGLVTQTSLRILDICMECGFSSSRYLNQMFVKRTGMKALEFRKQKNRPEPENARLPITDVQRRLSFAECREVIQ